MRPLRRRPEAGRRLLRELLPDEAIDRASELAREARLLVVGSSRAVYPVAGLPHETLAAGGAVAVVNQGPTWVDSRAALVVDAPAGETLTAAVAALDERPGGTL